MFARKFKTVIAVLVFGFAGLGFVLAEDPKPITPPPEAKLPGPGEIPAPVPPLSLQPLTQNLTPSEQNLKPGELQVVLDVTLVQVPTGFCEGSGLTVDNPMSKTGELMTFLSRREVKMLDALLQGYPGRRIIAEPKLIMRDGQTGSIRTAGPAEEVASLVATTTNGKTVYSPQILSLISYHLILQVTPKISKDKKMIELKVERQTSQVGEGITLNPPVPGDKEQAIQTPTTVPSINLQTQEAKVHLPDDGTVLIGNVIHSTQDKSKKMELLWKLTAHVVQGEK